MLGYTVHSRKFEKSFRDRYVLQNSCEDFRKFHRETPVLESLFNKPYYKQTSTQVFSGEICDIFSNVFIEHPLPAASVFSKDFFDISYENSHTRTRRLYVSAASLFFKYNSILVCGTYFSD